MLNKIIIALAFTVMILPAQAHATIDSIYEKQYSQNLEMLDDTGQVVDSEEFYDQNYLTDEDLHGTDPNLTDLGGIDYFEENQLIHLYKMNEMISL